MSLLTEATSVQTSAAIDYIKLVHKSESELICFGFLNSETKKFQQAFRSLDDAVKPEFYEKLQNANQVNSVYMSLNSFKSPERKTANVAFIRSIGLDLDKDGRANLNKLFETKLVFEPNIVFETSPDKFQAIWTVENISVEEAERISKALAAEFGGDPAATDAARVMRLPGFRNCKYTEKPEVEVVHLADRTGRLSQDAFKLILDKHPAPEAASGVAATAASGERARVAHGFHDSTLAFRAGQLRHSNVPLDKAIEILTQEVEDLYDGYGLDYREMVIKCVSSIYKHAPGPAGPTVLIGGKLPGQAVVANKNRPNVIVEESRDNPAPEFVDEKSEAAIPPFDPSVINGIYAEMVELITRGTTLAPQFAFVIAKTIIGIKMAGKVRFENLDVEPRYYTALIGETGSGKGEAWRRTMQILRPEGQTVSDNPCSIKIINSADSGAGIKDAFFEPPDNLPIVCYVDEVESLGNKSKDTRNPGILDTVIELADSTSVSRVLSKRNNGGGTKTKHDARFAMVMCGQDGNVYMKAFAGRTKLGLWDRFYPEFGSAQETGDLPPVNVEDAVKLFTKITLLNYSGIMTISQEAKDRVESFWNVQIASVRKKARWKKTLLLDAYMSAFGRGVMRVGPEDVAIAIQIFNRQLVIRNVCFTTEVPDRTGYYIGLIKNITENMQRQLDAGVSPSQAAKSRRDYEKLTNAHRDNEAHLFERAWQVHAPNWLQKVTIQKDNGQKYEKYLPLPEDN